MNSILGKTVKSVEKKYTWDGDEIEELTIRFNDGTFLIITANTDRGCEHCDPEGSLNDYLGFMDGKK